MSQIQSDIQMNSERISCSLGKTNIASLATPSSRWRPPMAWLRCARRSWENADAMYTPWFTHGLYMVCNIWFIHGLHPRVNLGEFGSAMLHAFRRSWITRSSHRWIPRTRWDPVTVEIAGHNSNQRWCFCIKLFNKCSTVQYSYFL